MSIFYARHPDVTRIHVSDDFIVDYDKSRGMYRVSTFEDYRIKDEYWFDAYEEKEIKEVYIVYGNINESGDTDTWVEAIFDNEEQALACAEWLNATKTQYYVNYYKSNGAWHLNKIDYVEKLNKLKSNN